MVLYLASKEPSLLVEQDHEGSTPIHYLCELGKLELVKQLLQSYTSQTLEAFGKRNRLMQKPYDLIDEKRHKGKAEKAEMRALVL